MAHSASQVPVASLGDSAPPASSGRSPVGVSPGDDLLSDGKESRPSNPAAARSAPGAPTEALSPSAASEWLDRWVERAHAGIDRLADVAEPRLQRLQEGMRATGGSLRRRAGQVREDGEAWAQSLRDTVRERPVTAIAVAAALGLLIARASR